jgi:hypothetical protein
MAGKKRITAARLREVLDYNPRTGKFSWLKRQKGRRSKVGTTSKRRYLCIKIDYVSYPAHRLAWLWMTGKWPSELTDHVNRKTFDNRWKNIREATASQNSRNRLQKNQQGCSWHVRKRKWIVRLAGRHIGYFNTKREAKIAYKQEAAILYGNFLPR